MNELTDNQIIFKLNGESYKGSIISWEQNVTFEKNRNFSNQEFRVSMDVMIEKIIENNISSVTWNLSSEKYNEEVSSDNMSVKIKKQLREISLNEFKKSDVQYEQVVLIINTEKKEELENKYGIEYNFTEKISLNMGEIEFFENYLKMNHLTVPYILIEKIMVRDL